MRSRRRSATYTAVLQDVKVFHEEREVGFGRVFFDDQGGVHVPELYQVDGGTLPEGSYNLQYTGQMLLVVVPKRIVQ